MKRYWKFYLGAFCICLVLTVSWNFISGPSRSIASAGKPVDYNMLKAEAGFDTDSSLDNYKHHDIGSSSCEQLGFHLKYADRLRMEYGIAQIPLFDHDSCTTDQLIAAKKELRINIERIAAFYKSLDEEIRKNYLPKHRKYIPMQFQVSREGYRLALMKSSLAQIEVELLKRAVNNK